MVAVKTGITPVGTYTCRGNRVSADKRERGATLSPQPDCKRLSIPVSFKFSHHRRQQTAAGGDAERLSWSGQRRGSCCSVAQLSLTLCDPMGCSTPGFPVLHYLLELAQTHVH